MNSKIYKTLILLWFYVFQGSNSFKRKSLSVPRGFLFYRTVSVTQKSCTCPMTFSCSCCQNVIILYTKSQKSLCVNYTFQRNGLNIDVTLSSVTIRAMTVTDYKSMRFCVHVPRCLFSTACINILELKDIQQSIAACHRMDIFSKKQLWQINFDCISISKQLPVIPGNGTMQNMNSSETTTGSTTPALNQVTTPMTMLMPNQTTSGSTVAEEVGMLTTKSKELIYDENDTINDSANPDDNDDEKSDEASGMEANTNNNPEKLKKPVLNVRS